MTIFFVVTAGVCIVLFSISNLKRTRKNECAVSSLTEADLSRQGDTNTIGVSNESVSGSSTADVLQEQTDFRQSAGFHRPSAAGRRLIRKRTAAFFRRRFQRTSLANELQPGPTEAGVGGPDGLCAATRRQMLHDECCSVTLNLLPLPILIANPQNMIIFANAAVETLFGHSRAQLSGMDAHELVPALTFNAGAADSIYAGFGSAGRRPGEDRELVAKRRNGSEFPAEVTINRVLSGGETCTLMIVTDRTERYELLRNRQQLAHLTRVSTLGELAGSLAHELNQPLTGILSNAQAAQRFLAAEPVNVAEVREILRDLIEDSHRASEVIRKMRALVRKGELEAVPLSIASVIKDVALLVHSDTIVRRIHLIVAVTPELPPVHGDKVQLQQVLLNLLLNAFDALEACSVLSREVAIEAILEGGDTIRVAVRDSGTGLAGNTFDKLFLPFFTSKRDGLGLGLSISRSIVEMHGGRIWAQNNQDHGATFYFTLPTGAAAKRTRLLQDQ